MQFARRLCTVGQQLSRMALRCSSTAAAVRAPAAAAATAPRVQAALRRAAPAAAAGLAGLCSSPLAQRLPLRALTVAAAAQPDEPAAAAAAAEEVRCSSSWYALFKCRHAEQGMQYSTQPALCSPQLGAAPLLLGQAAAAAAGVRRWRHRRLAVTAPPSPRPCPPALPAAGQGIRYCQFLPPGGHCPALRGTLLGAAACPLC